MNVKLFMNQIEKILYPKYWQDMANENNPIVSVLTIHLTCESFLEAYICAHLDIPDLFQTVKDKNKVNFKLNFSLKLLLAQRLGLPIEAYYAIDCINSIRNQFVHRLEGIIDYNLIKKIEENTNLIITKAINDDVKNECMELYHPDTGVLEKTYKYDDKNTPVIVKLVILYESLIRRLISVTAVTYIK